MRSARVVLALVTCVGAAAHAEQGPEATVLQYVAASNQHRIDAMVALRDFLVQARESLSHSALGAVPSNAEVERVSQNLEQRFRTGARTDRQDPRICTTPTAHYEKPSLARVVMSCERQIGDNTVESSVVNVRLARTETGWRIIDNGAD